MAGIPLTDAMNGTLTRFRFKLFMLWQNSMESQVSDGVRGDRCWVTSNESRFVLTSTFADRPD